LTFFKLSSFIINIKHAKEEVATRVNNLVSHIKRHGNVFVIASVIRGKGLSLFSFVQIGCWLRKGG